MGDVYNEEKDHNWFENGVLAGTEFVSRGKVINSRMSIQMSLKSEGKLKIGLS